MGSSVKATIERYKKASDSSNTGSVAEVNAQFYQQEAEKLRNQIRNLQNTNRHMLGESVGGLPMKEFKSLESRLEKGISRIRSKKNELLFAEIEYMQKKMFPFGSVPLKTFLPDGDIDLTALSHQNMEENFARYICSILQDNQQNSEVLVQDVQYIRHSYHFSFLSHGCLVAAKFERCLEVKIVKCTVNDIPVDISFNQTAGLSALCFLEKV
ncbi:agamous-like MADS-box protein AGL21 [Gossypium arboreum]|uniref:agamous-like MADS-box protein AGL21 n=1 Tax=Gossypium arboreum TaxID=29729 RepID=UPI0022F14A91|nr:agamous-like MADS-box protein AGL21 [Gossypium arboreum]XP_052877269.1 agamous-like MADS-box protein AGL21 [Gossypium arboreum]